MSPIYFQPTIPFQVLFSTNEVHKIWIKYEKMNKGDHISKFNFSFMNSLNLRFSNFECSKWRWEPVSTIHVYLSTIQVYLEHLFHLWNQIPEIEVLVIFYSSKGFHHLMVMRSCPSYHCVSMNDCFQMMFFRYFSMTTR